MGVFNLLPVPSLGGWQALRAVVGERLDQLVFGGFLLFMVPLTSWLFAVVSTFAST
jgi:Zn-dependent protease